jgi:hypothetical protein
VICLDSWRVEPATNGALRAGLMGNFAEYFSIARQINTQAESFCPVPMA